MMALAASLETRDLRLVLAIADAGGATRAARLLALSQSAVSHQLRNLEDRLGQNVFERDGRKLRITPAGERLLVLAREILPPIAETERDLKRGVTARRVELRVATQCYTAFHWLPRALIALTQHHPEVDLALPERSAVEVAHALGAGELDLGLCIGKVKGAGLERVELFHDELVLAVPFGHPLARQKFVEGPDLVNETLLAGYIEESQRKRVVEQLFGQGGGVRRVVRLPLTEDILDLVRAGVGVSIVASFTLGPKLERRELQAVRLTRRGIERTWSAVFPKSSRLRAPIETLLGSISLPRRQPLSKR
jgi:LysR family transcriptional regulator for metE and metH